MTERILDTGVGGSELQLWHGPLVDADTGGGVTHATTRVRLEWAECWLWTNGIVLNDSTNQQDCWGTLVDDDTWSNDISDEWDAVWLRDLTPLPLPIVYGAVGSGVVGLSTERFNALGYMEGEAFFELPRRPYSAPAAPTSVTIGNGTAGCTGHQLTPSADKLWSTTNWWLQVDDGAFVPTYGRPADASTWTFAAEPNRRYRVAVNAWNADAGDGPQTLSSYFYTTPAAPASVTAVRQAVKTTVRVTWVNAAAHAAAFEIGRSLDGGAWAVVGQSSTTTFDDTNVPLGSTARYRVTAKTPAPVAASSATESSLVPSAYAVPDAPNVTLTRISDTSLRVTISGHQGNPALDKYWAELLWSLQTDTGDFVEGGPLAGDTPNFLISDLSADHRYQVRVWATNATGAGAVGTTGYVYTTPSAPTVMTASRVGVTEQVDLAWTPAARWPADHLVQRSVDSGPFTTLVTTAGTSATDTLAGTSYAVYRVITRTPFPSVESAPRLSPTVVPNATDKHRLPGVDSIFAGETKVFRILSGTNQIWLG